MMHVAAGNGGIVYGTAGAFLSLFGMATVHSGTDITAIASLVSAVAGLIAAVTAIVLALRPHSTDVVVHVEDDEGHHR